MKSTTFTRKAAVAAGSLAAFSNVPQTAEADIIHVDNVVGAEFSSGPNDISTIGWDVDGNGVDDFEISTTGTSTISYIKHFRGINNAANQLVADAPHFRNLQALPLNFEVDATIAPYGFDDKAEALFAGVMAANGFTSGSPGFMGFQFDRAGNTHFGWAEVTVTANGDPGTIDVLQWAWEDTPNTSILAGATGSAAAVPEPSSLGLLALGAVGVGAWRRRKTQKQECEPETV